MAFSKTLRALEKFEPKKLGTELLYLRVEGLFCAIGAAAHEAGIPPTNSYEAIAAKLGLTEDQLTLVYRENDSFGRDASRRDAGLAARRYEHMLSWLRERVKENRAAQKARKTAKAASR